MSISTETRRGYLGASDIAAVLGLSPWRSAYEVWAEKTGRLEGDADSKAIALGNAIEPVLLDWAESQLGPLTRQKEVAIDGTPIVCHPDAITEAGDPVEAKTSGIAGPIYGEWGEPGSDQIPQYYLVQCLVQLAATNGELCHVPALLGGRGFVMYAVPADDSLQSEIIERASTWWERHVVADTPPSLEAPPPLDVLKRIRRVPGKLADINPELVQRWLEAKEAAKQATKIAEESQAAIIAALGDAEGAELPDGRELTYFEQVRREYVVPAGSFRVLRVRKKK